MKIMTERWVEDIWEPIDGPIADDIERLNCASLTNVVAGLVKSRLARHTDGKPPIPDEAALLLFHRTAMQFLLAQPGRYRPGAGGRVRDGVVVLRGAPKRKLKGLMQQFFRDLAALWETGDALDVASFVLWRITYIHPFINGNGRAAVAFAYACLCLKLGALLPGRETFMDRIFAEPTEFRNALRIADQGLARPDRKPDLSALKAYLDDLLLRQIQGAEAEVGATVA